MERIYFVDPNGIERRVLVRQGNSSALLRVETVIRTAAARYAQGRSQ